MQLLLFALLLVGSTAGSPAIGQTLMSIAQSVQRYVPPPDNSLALQAILADGISSANMQSISGSANTLLGRVVTTLVEARLNTHYYAGMCPRNYTSPCPQGFEPDSPEQPTKCIATNINDDTPPACTSLDLTVADSETPFGTMLAKRKETFAVKCGVMWPCASCTRNFNYCPLGWITTETKGLCQSPKGYLGLCPGEMDFRKFSSNMDKARWAASCLDEWPCDPE